MKAGDKTFYDTYWQAQSRLACDEKCREAFIVSEVKSFLRSSGGAAISMGSGLRAHTRIGSLAGSLPGSLPGPLPGSTQGREPAATRILDVGCGRGWLTHILSSFGEVIGCDQSTVEARRRYPQIHFVECDVLDLETVFGTGGGDSTRAEAGARGPGCASIDSAAGKAPFDLAVCSEVIEHISKEDQPRLLAAISAILRPEGELILTSPNKPVAANTVEKLMLQHELQPVENWLDAPGLRRMAEPYFDVVELGTVMFFPANLRKIGPLSRVYRALYEQLGGYKVVDPILRGTRRGLYLALAARKKRA